MTSPLRIHTPLSEEVVLRLKTGDRVLFNGPIYAARVMTSRGPDRSCSPAQGRAETRIVTATTTMLTW